MRKNLWKRTLILENKSILDAIKSLDAHGMQISLVINKNKKITGILNDGDLRRAILSKVKLTDPIKKIMNKKPILIKKNTSRNRILELMNSHKITSLPIVNQKRIVTGLVRWDDVFKKSIVNPLIIMSGGKGKRMLPLTKNTPKSLLKIKGKAIIQHILEKASDEGFKEIYISVNYLGHKIREFVNKTPLKKKLNIRFIEEKKILGTAGSLGLIKNNKNPIVVINGDVITDVKFRDLLQFYKEHKSDATMAVKMVLNQIEFGVIKNIQSKIINLEEKPLDYSMVNAGIYILSSKTLKYIKKNKKMDMTELFSILMKKKLKVTAFPIHEKWNDIGNKENYNRLK